MQLYLYSIRPGFDRRVIVDCDPDKILANGGKLSPTLRVQYSIKIEDISSSQQITPLLTSASLFLATNNTIPVSSSQWAVSSQALFIPLSHPIIDSITSSSQTNPEERVTFQIQFFTLLEIELQSEVNNGINTLKQLHACQTEPTLIYIDRPHWNTWLTSWGYPEYRLVPITATLPSGIQGLGKPQELWKHVIDTISQIHQLIRTNQWEHAGDQMRRAAEYALYTWCAIWGHEEPGDRQDAAAALNFLDSAISDCRPQNGKLPGKGASPDAIRICARYLALRTVYNISHSPHHIGHRDVYTSEDIRYLVNTLTETISLLPSLWEEYPNPV